MDTKSIHKSYSKSKKGLKNTYSLPQRKTSKFNPQSIKSHRGRPKVKQFSSYRVRSLDISPLNPLNKFSKHKGSFKSSKPRKSLKTSKFDFMEVQDKKKTAIELGKLKTAKERKQFLDHVISLRGKSKHLFDVYNAEKNKKVCLKFITNLKKQTQMSKRRELRAMTLASNKRSQVPINPDALSNRRMSAGDKKLFLNV